MMLQGLGGAGRSCVLEATTNFEAIVAWTTLSTNTAATNGAFQFIDSQAGGFSRRFYRVSAK
jgi:hypothetical protein